MSESEKNSLTYFKHKNLRDLPSTPGMICTSEQSDEFTTDMDLFNGLQRDKNRVLINCIHGHSRSASVVIYYLIRKYNLNLPDAFHFINERRYIWPKYKIILKLNV